MITKTVTIFCDDIVEFRSVDSGWTVNGKVPLLSIGCKGLRACAFEGLTGNTFRPKARLAGVIDPGPGRFGW